MSEYNEESFDKAANAILEVFEKNTFTSRKKVIMTMLFEKVIENMKASGKRISSSELYNFFLHNMSEL